jgi:two-component system, sensor histidine kinase RpfC
MVRPDLAALRRTLASPLALLRARLSGRPDSEHEQALVRVTLGLLLGFWLLPEILERRAAGEPHILVWFSYTAASVALFVAILRSPGVSSVRRTIGATIDAATTTWCMVHFEALAAPMILIYVWSTVGMGFRFGPRQLLMALALSVAGFATVLFLSDFWRQHLTMGIGFMVGLIVLCLYVRKLVRQLFDAVARAESANQAKRRFISVVSHEMRTPLNAIIGMADLLRQTPLSKEQADMLQTLRGSSRVMLNLVEDVLDFSKIEAGKLALEKADFDVHALVNSTCRILSSQALAKGIDLVVSIMPDVPPAVRGDPHYLRQVLINLVGNAVKFTEQGSVTVHVSAQEESEGSVRLKFSIRDTGIGIAPEAQARIFESFAQADQSTTRRFGGTGLGTTIAKQLVDLMQGRIGLESAVGLGTTFWFDVPLDKQITQPGEGVGELAGARVLLVGFPPAEREPVEQALVGWGAVPAACADIDEAAGRVVAEISVARPFHSALVYAAGNDFSLAQRFRRAVPHPAPPTVLAIPREAAVARFDALLAGFAAVLELPFEKRQFFNVLHSVVALDDARDGVVRLEDYARRGTHDRRLRVLVADDNPTNREVLGRILERGGHEARLVQGGEEALDAIERERYDIVLLDRNMPGLGGIEALRAIRMITRGQERLPTAILSADVTPEAKREALEAGADAFLSKPIEVTRLLHEIQRLVDEGARPAASVAPSRASEPATPLRPPGAPAAINLETLRHLEELGSAPDFIDRLVRVFVGDNEQLLGRIERAVAGRNYHELRNLLHAMKGSSASMGTDRLTRACVGFERLSDAELRLQAPGLLRSLADELALSRQHLESYIQGARKSAG